MPELLPLAARPRFARKLLAVWRLHHLASGDRMHILIWPGEWAVSEPREVKGVPVDESDRIGGAGAVMVIGRVRGTWRCAYNVAVAAFLDMSLDDVALTTAYMQVPEEGRPRMWLHPDPEDGEVPMWEVVRRG